jgi:hypothetical protein
MLSMLFATLDVKSRTESETEPDVSEGPDMGTSATVQQSSASGSSEQVQPVFFVLQQILPLLHATISKWYADTHVVQVGSNKLLFHF